MPDSTLSPVLKCDAQAMVNVNERSGMVKNMVNAQTCSDNGDAYNQTMDACG